VSIRKLFIFFIYSSASSTLTDLPFVFSSVIAPNLSEENKRVHEHVEVLIDLSQPHGIFRTNKSKAPVVAKFQDRVQQVHRFFDKCRAGLAMIWNTIFLLNPAPPTPLTLISNFRNAARVRALVRSQLLAGPEIALAFVLAQHPSLELELINKADA
jgi:hypothetical protein